MVWFLKWLMGSKGFQLCHYYWWIYMKNCLLLKAKWNLRTKQIYRIWAWDRSPWMSFHCHTRRSDANLRCLWKWSWEERHSYAGDADQVQDWRDCGRKRPIIRFYLICCLGAINFDEQARRGRIVLFHFPACRAWSIRASNHICHKPRRISCMPQDSAFQAWSE